MVTAPSGRISIHALGLNGSRATGACEPRGSNAGRYSPITRVAPAAAPVLRKSRRLTIAWLMSHLWSVRSGQPTTGVTTTSIVLVLSRSCQSLGTSLVRLRTARHVRPPQGTLRPPVACRQRSPTLSTSETTHAVCQPHVPACNPAGAVRVRRLVRRRCGARPSVRARSHHERGDEAPDHHIFCGCAGPLSPRPTRAGSRPVYRRSRALQGGRRGRPELRVCVRERRQHGG